MSLTRWLVGLLLFSSLMLFVANKSSAESLPICKMPQPPSTRRCATAPIRTNSPSLNYTEEARRAGLEGEVVLSLVISKKGVPRDVRVTKTLDKGLDEQAMTSVRQLRFKPGTYKNHPVSVKATLRVYFGNCKSYGMSGAKSNKGDFTAIESDKVPADLIRRLRECSSISKDVKKLQCPRLMHMLPPQDIEKAQQADLEGPVVLSFTINSIGKTEDVHLLKSLGMGLDEQVVTAAAKWRYRPAVYKGEPFPVRANVALEFGRCKAATAYWGAPE
jgi:TonB family protein